MIERIIQLLISASTAYVVTHCDSCVCNGHWTFYVEPELINYFNMKLAWLEDVNNRSLSGPKHYSASVEIIRVGLQLPLNAIEQPTYGEYLLDLCCK